MNKSTVLFLQGPLGPFFRELAEAFSQTDYDTHKINLNGGDRYFSGADKVVDYHGEPSEWPRFFHNYLVENAIDTVFLLGDCRYYHRSAKPVCDQLGVRFMVFEEGYIRPNTVTLERDGVNALSNLDLSQPVIRQTEINSTKTSLRIGPNMRQRAVYAALYYWAAFFTRKQFPHYEHHRAFNPIKEGYCWLRGFARKWQVKPSDYLLHKKLTGTFSHRFILVPLQVHDDSQKIYHSDYDSVQSFISEVMTSFKTNADPSRILCFKHHPMDRGYTHYGSFIKSQAKNAGIEDRVFYCHDNNLPELYRHAQGVVTVNSTVGVSALLHGVPTKVMGKAMYDIAGLTHQGSLASFWKAPQPVDKELFQRFYSLLLEKTQVNGSFFKFLDISCQNALQFYEQLIEGDDFRSSPSIHPLETGRPNNLDAGFDACDLPLNAA